MTVTIVCIDDEPALLRVFRSVLRKTGAVVEGFTDPFEALAFVQQNEVALVISDLRMPGLTGLELLGRIGKPVPFLLVSGNLDAAARVAGVPGVAAVVEKPFTPSTLLEVVRAQLGK